jgi:hypothetical protein
MNTNTNTNTKDIVVLPEEIKVLSMESLNKYFGFLVKFRIVKNGYTGLRRSLTRVPYFKQEFIPDENIYYILSHIGTHLAFKSICKDEDIRRHWYFRPSSSGIVHFTMEEHNRYDITEIHIYEYITPDIEKLLDDIHMTRLSRIRKDMLNKYYKIITVFPIEILEKIVNFIPIEVNKIMLESLVSNMEEYHHDKKARH